MKVILDTNVVVSALLNPYGTPASILGLIVEEKIILCHDVRILVEYQEVLSRPRFNFSKPAIDALLEFIKETGASYIATKFNLALKDPDDLPFAEIAAVSEADFLITGNCKHFPEKIGHTKVVSPGEFMKAFRG